MEYGFPYPQPSGVGQLSYNPLCIVGQFKQFNLKEVPQHEKAMATNPTHSRQPP